MAADTGQTLPALESRVKPSAELAFHWNAFFELSSDRSLGMGVGPIPWTAIDRYAARYGVTDQDEFDVFVRLVRAMDAVFVADFSKQQK